MLAEHQRGNILFRRFPVRLKYNAVDDSEFDIRIIVCHSLHDRPLGKTDSDYQIEIPFGKRPHRRLDRGWIARFDVVKTDVQLFLRPLHAIPCRRVERTVILPSNVEHDADPRTAALSFCVSTSSARRYQEREKE